MLIKKTGADTIDISNPVLADCPPVKGAETMLRQSDKITALSGQRLYPLNIINEGNSRLTVPMTLWEYFPRLY